jgi:hypothetical protein
MTRRFWTVEYSVALAVVLGDFLTWAVKLVRGLIHHTGVHTEYFVGLAATGYLCWFMAQLTRRKLRAKNAESKDTVTIQVLEVDGAG